MVWRNTWHIRYLLSGRPTLRRGVPLVRVVCGACGALVAVVEDHEGHVMVLVADRRYTLARLDLVACPRHGQLGATWDRLRPAMDRAGEKRRTVVVRATPLSMP